MDTDDFLMHYGIKGQKWGDRRYQYEDGTLTPEGIERYRKLKKKINQDTLTAYNKRNLAGTRAIAGVGGLIGAALGPKANEITSEKISKAYNIGIGVGSGATTLIGLVEGASIGNPLVGLGVGVAGAAAATGITLARKAITTKKFEEAKKALDNALNDNKVTVGEVEEYLDLYKLARKQKVE